MTQNSFSFRKWGRWQLALSLALILGTFILVYSVIVMKNTRLDLTRSKMFTLSPVTMNVLKEIKNENVRVFGFFRHSTSEREAFKELLACYRSSLAKLEIKIFDPDRSPSQTRRFRVDDYGTIIFEFRGRRERIVGFNEEKITNALLKIIRNERKKIYFVIGHGEWLLESERAKGLALLAGRLKDENYLPEKLALIRQGVPGDASCVIIAGPKTDFSGRELKFLDEYLEGCGRLLLLVDPLDPGTLTQFEKWLAARGVFPGSDIIVDKLGKMLGADFLVPVITQYANHEITKDFSLASFLPVSRSIGLPEPARSDLEVTPLAYTSSSSWAETDLKALAKGDAFLDPSRDRKGPVPIACLVEPALKDPKGYYQLIVFGDSDFIVNSNIHVSGNRDLILNSIAWLAGEKSLVSIREKKRPDTPLVLQARDKQILFWLPTVYIPAAILLFGAWVHWHRKETSKAV